MPDWYHVSEAHAMQTLPDEIRSFTSRIGSRRAILLHLALLAVFGIWIPLQKGPDFFDPQVLGAYACLGLLFAGPAAAQAFPEGTPSLGIARARVLVSVLYGELVVLAMLAAGIATVYLSHRGSFVLPPDWESLAWSGLFGLGAATMVASMTAWVTLRFSRRAAILCDRLLFFGLLILFFYSGRRLPELGLAAAAGCFVIAGLFFELLRRACRSE